MGLQWLNEIVRLLTGAGIRAGESFPAAKRPELTGPVAAVGLRGMDWQAGTAEFEIRILSPRVLGGWECQNAAAEAVSVLEENGISCRMEQMGFREADDCFEMTVIGTRQVMERTPETAASLFRILIDGVEVPCVTDFSAEQDRQRRIIGAVNQAVPSGITPGSGGWQIRMVQTIPQGSQTMAEPEEPFSLSVVENGLTTVYGGCGWNVVKKQLDQEKTVAVWEGFALTREETANG